MPHHLSPPRSIAIENISMDWQWFLAFAFLPILYRLLLLQKTKRKTKPISPPKKVNPPILASRIKEYLPSHRWKSLDETLNKNLSRDHPHHSAYRRITRSQIYTLLTLLTVFVGLLILFPKSTGNTLFYIYILISCMIVFFKAYLFLGLKDHSSPLRTFKDQPLPQKIVTIFCPLYKEKDSLPHLYKALENLEYPKSLLDVKILLEEDDIETIKAASRIFSASYYDLIVLPPSSLKTKPRALNIGLWRAKGDYCVIYDAEDRPETDQLRKAVQHFEDVADDIACLQAKLNFYNARENSLTRLFSLEYGLLFDFLIPCLAQGRFPIPLGGTSNFFKTDILKKIGGWDPYNVTEDADIGLRLHHYGYHSEYLDSTTWEEATHTILPWCRQRSRWIKGYIQTWLVHTRAQPPHTSMIDKIKWHAVLHLIVGGNIFAALFNPIFWGLFLYMIIFPGDNMSFYTDTTLGIIATFIFLISNMILLYLYVLTPIKRRHFKLAICAPLFPFYWGLQSLAGYYALWQFFKNPYYWEKTPHFINRDAE